MSDQKSDIIMRDGESTSGSLNKSIDENSPIGKPTSADRDGSVGQQLSGSEGHSQRPQSHHRASKLKGQLDQANSVFLEIQSSPCPLEETDGMPISNLLADTETLEEILKERQRNANLISQLQTTLSQSEDSLRTTKVELKESQSTCKALQDRIEDLGEDLKETREQVFRLQPLRENITQKDALEDYTAICHSVKSWIGLRLDNALNTGVLNAANFSLASARKLISLLAKVGLDGMQYSQTDEHNIVAIVMQFLRTEIFEREFYGAVEGEHLALLAQIEKNMKSLNPRRDRASRRSWRIETLDALVHSTDFDRRESERAEILSTELVRLVGVIDNALLNEECVKSMESKIIIPAIHLARKLHLSHSQFSVQFSGYDPSSPARGAQDLHMLEEFDCIDVLAYGKPVKLDGKGQAITGDSVTYLFDILPGFYCKTFRQDIIEEKVLKKPQVLVMVTKPGQNEYQRAAHSGEDRTILRSIYDRIRKRR